MRNVDGYDNVAALRKPEGYLILFLNLEERRNVFIGAFTWNHMDREFRFASDINPL